MRKLFLIVCFGYLAAAVHGQINIQNGLYFGGNSFMSFSANSRIETWDVDYKPGYDDPQSLHLLPKKNPRSGTFAAGNTEGIDFLDVRWAGGANERYLILLISNEGLIFYKADSEPFFAGDRYIPGEERFGRGLIASLISGSSHWISASSSLTEGRISYSTDKLGFAIGECWAEGARGAGIGETLTLDLSQIVKLYISSGFVSFAKPYLFRENARIKRIRITNEDGESETVLLADTPHFQALELKMGLGFGKFKLEILEVYPGAKYTDTCVNSILGLFSQ